MPVHSKAYYAQYEGQGYKVSFSVSYKPIDETVDQFSKYAVDNAGKAYTFAWGNWYTISYSLDSLITNYDNITAEKETNKRADRPASLFRLSGNNLGTTNYNTLQFNVYMSEMTIAKA